MPSIPLHPPARAKDNDPHPNPLPQLLQTPSGLAILEIQGTINMPLIEPADPGHEIDTEASYETSIGRLIFPDYTHTDSDGSTAWMKRVYLYVGRHQRLTGEVKKLPNPMAVIRRKDNFPDTSADVGDEELEIVEIVYHKILFSSRPEPVGN